MATDADLEAALSFSAANVFGLPATTVGAPEVARLKAWFEAAYAEQLDGNPATADDIAALLWRQVGPKVSAHEEREDIERERGAGRVKRKEWSQERGG